MQSGRSVFCPPEPSGRKVPSRAPPNSEGRRGRPSGAANRPAPSVPAGETPIPPTDQQSPRAESVNLNFVNRVTRPTSPHHAATHRRETLAPMNYFAHGLSHLDRPYFLAGTAVPDWLSVSDRPVRLRPRLLDPWIDGSAELQSEVAAGAKRHLDDDQWFHATRGFVETTAEMTVLFRELLAGGDGFRCGFLGHIVTELLLDAVLIEAFPDRLRDYYDTLSAVEAVQIQTAVNRMAKRPAERLAGFIELFVRERILECYQDDRRLLRRLNQVQQRVKLAPLPPETVAVLATGRDLVRRRVCDLLPPERFPWP